MTTEEMKKWIDKATYQELLMKQRFEPAGSPWFTKEIGEYFIEAMKRRRDGTPHSEQVAASKAIG